MSVPDNIKKNLSSVAAAGQKNAWPVILLSPSKTTGWPTVPGCQPTSYLCTLYSCTCYMSQEFPRNPGRKTCYSFSFIATEEKVPAAVFITNRSCQVCSVAPASLSLSLSLSLPFPLLSLSCQVLAPWSVATAVAHLALFDVDT